MTLHEDRSASGLNSVACVALRRGDRDGLQRAAERLRVYLDRCDPDDRKHFWQGKLAYLDDTLSTLPPSAQPALF